MLFIYEIELNASVSEFLTGNVQVSQIFPRMMSLFSSVAGYFEGNRNFVHMIGYHVSSESQFVCFGCCRVDKVNFKIFCS